jgi:competence protein ComEA
MIFLEKQTRGIIVICVVLAIIPFVIFISGSKINYHIPEFADQSPQKNVVEVVENGKSQGIYFVSPKTSVNQLLKSINVEVPDKEDLILNSGTKITIDSASENKHVTIAGIEPNKLLALGMPIDINLATESDLLLITGIGEVTAKKILDLRSKLGKFEKIEQLTEVKGIKEKKLAKLRKYLYVANQ